MVTNSYHEVVANLQKEKDDLLVKPITLADNKKDTEPMAIQTAAEVKKWTAKMKKKFTFTDKFWLIENVMDNNLNLI